MIDYSGFNDIRLQQIRIRLKKMHGGIHLGNIHYQGLLEDIQTYGDSRYLEGGLNHANKSNDSIRELDEKFQELERINKFLREELRDVQREQTTLRKENDILEERVRAFRKNKLIEKASNGWHDANEILPYGNTLVFVRVKYRADYGANCWAIVKANPIHQYPGKISWRIMEDLGYIDSPEVLAWRYVDEQH